MSDERERIEIPEDLSPPINPKVENDPEVIAEEKKLRLSELRWKRYLVAIKGTAIGLQTFKAEAVSVVTGIGTFVVGYYQWKKYRYQDRAESRAIGKAEGLDIGRARERRERREDKQESLELRGGGQQLGSGSGYGSGAGRVGSAPKNLPVEVKKAKTLAKQRLESLPAPVAEVMASAPEAVEMPIFSTMNALTIVLPAITVWSMWRSWMKRKKKLADEGGRRNGD